MVSTYDASERSAQVPPSCREHVPWLSFERDVLRILNDNSSIEYLEHKLEQQPGRRRNLSLTPHSHRYDGDQSHRMRKYDHGVGDPGGMSPNDRPQREKFKRRDVVGRAKQEDISEE